MLCFKLRRTATETHKMLTFVYRKKFHFACIPSSGLKDSERNVSILEMIPRTGYPSPNDIQYQVKKLRNWWPEIAIFSTEHATNTLYGNTGNKATYAMQQPRRAKMSNTLQQKPQILYSICLLTRPK